MSQNKLEYYCSSCKTLLRETDHELSYVIESCPACGSFLSETLQKIPLVQKITKPVFQHASSIPRLTFDIEKLDSVLHFLTLDQKICITGIHTQNLVERLCVRAQLPRQYGGLGTKVLLIDGANSSDLYQCIDFAQQYGMNANKVLNGIISSRIFTVYQLVNLILQELENAIKYFDVKLIVITNLLYFFTNDPYLDNTEMKKILVEVIKSIEKIKDCLVIVTLGSKTLFDDMIQKLFSITIKIESANNALSVDINTINKHSVITLQKDELEKIW